MPILLARMFAFRRTHKGADIAHSNDFKVFFATSIKAGSLALATRAPNFVLKLKYPPSADSGHYRFQPPRGRSDGGRTIIPACPIAASRTAARGLFACRGRCARKSP